MECRLWYFEGLLNDNQLTIAESGFHGIHKRASKNTRLYIEASHFLAVCLLRQKKVKEAKVLFREILRELNKIQSPNTRRLLQKRILERIEEESVLAGLTGIDEGILNPERIHAQAVSLIQKSEDDILETMAAHMPYNAGSLLRDVRNDVILQLSEEDRKFLPAPGQVSQPLRLGRIVFNAVRRISWKTLCEQQSPIYKLWSRKMPEVYTAAYFATSVTKAFSNWKIGMPMLAAGVVTKTDWALRLASQLRLTLPTVDDTRGGRRFRKFNFVRHQSLTLI